MQLRDNERRNPIPSTVTLRFKRMMKRLAFKKRVDVATACGINRDLYAAIFVLHASQFSHSNPDSLPLSYLLTHFFAVTVILTKFYFSFRRTVMTRFVLIVASLTFCSSASAQIYSYPQVESTYVGPTVVQEALPFVGRSGGTFTSSSIGSVVPASYPSTINAAARAVSANSFPSTASSQVTPGLAQQKAQQAAAANLRGHLNNQLGGARYEGVGWSSVSPRSAVQNCCYWGTRPVAQIGVSRGSDGCWYACVLYQ